jgi:hypothetical protein
MKVSQNFWEKMLILFATAALTGFLFPYILRRFEENKAIEQRRLDADISRQTKIIEAQSTFLDETTETLWRWRYLSMKVAYNGTEQREEQYAASVKEYEAGIWDVLSDLRNHTSKSRRLVSEKGYQSLVTLYDQITDLDGRLDQIVRQKLPPKERAEALEVIHRELRWEMTQKLDDTLALLAQEVQLTSPHSMAGESE